MKEEDGYEDDVSLSPTSPPPVKHEQEDDEEDKYEDALDLDTSQEHAKVWLVRMPKFLLEQWQDVDFNGQELGKVRIMQSQAGPGASKTPQVRLILNDDETTADLPHQYDLSLVHQVVDNTYVFRETDLPEPEKPARPPPDPAQAAERDFDRFQPVVRQVPKKTALVGTVCNECVVTPDFKDPNYSNVLRKRKRMEMPEPERQVTLLNDTAGVGGVKYGATLRQQRDAVARSTQRREMQRNVDGKAIRIPKNELLDKLFALFEEFEYWTLRGLREKTHQPEAYLKEVLDNIAVLNKKGPYAMKYSLKPEFKQMRGQGVAITSMLEPAAVKDEEESDEDEMEDII